MRAVRSFVAVVLFLLIPDLPTRAQNAPRLERWFGIGAHQSPAPPLAPLQGLQEHAASAKLVLSLDDPIRLSLANNTDIRLARSQTESALNRLHRAHRPLDPLVTSGFAHNGRHTPA